MHLVQSVDGEGKPAGFLINPAWTMEGTGVVLATDDGIRCLMRAGKVTKPTEAVRRMRTMSKFMELECRFENPELSNTTVPGVGYCTAWTADVVLLKPAPKNVWFECAGDCNAVNPNEGFTAFTLEFDVGTILNVFRGQTMCVLLIKFLLPDANPYALMDPLIRGKLIEAIVPQIKGFKRYKSAEAWAAKTGIQKVRLCLKR